jgi:CheY-like chemotaxis protein
MDVRMPEMDGLAATRGSLVVRWSIPDADHRALALAAARRVGVIP